MDVSACTMPTTSAPSRRSSSRRRCGSHGAAPLDVDAAHARAVALEHLREAIAEVAGDDRRPRACPAATALATAASIADVPVPDVASVSAFASARNTRCSRPRTSSSIGTKSGSR